MTTRPYELLARFSADGTVAGVSVRTITTVNGKDYEGDPEPLSGADDPAFVAFAATFSAAAVAERDALLADKSQLEADLAAMTTERDQLGADLATMTAARDQAAADLETLGAQRDQLAAELETVTAELATATTERDAALSGANALASQLADVSAELDALKNPPVNPRHVAPFDFLSLFTPGELLGVLTSADPIVTLGRAKLQTIITFVDLDHTDTIQLVGYLEQIGLIGAGRATEILAGEAPQ